MSKAETTAIIDAIRESVGFLMTNGMSIRQGISNSTQDAAHVASLLSGYSSDIDTIIANIPDDNADTPDDNQEE